ncbi:MAG: hypothetical protein Q9220_006436 [cf. Caloplaca sp. 1 TL-2023]
MASDEIVWQVINQQFCSYKLKLPSHHQRQKSTTRTFCRNTHNVTGLCNRQSCPLANSQYATIRSSPDSGALYLYLKIVERAHLPSRQWEKVKLSANYARALEQIDTQLQYWPKFLSHKCKQRLTRLTQVSIRTRKLLKEETRLGEKLVPKLAPKIRRREEGRERKAEAAAKVERAIERELVERLRSGAYGDRPLNVEEGVWKKVLKGLERGGEGERDVDLDDGEEEEEEREVEVEEEREGLGGVEYVSDVEESEEEEDLGDLEDWLGGESQDVSEDDDDDDEEEGDSEGTEEDGSDVDGELKKKKKKPMAGQKRKHGRDSMPRRKAKGPKLEIEYEREVEPPLREAILA